MPVTIDHTLSTVFDLVWFLCLADNMVHDDERKLITCTCKNMRDRNHELRDRRCAWLYSTIKELRKLPWTRHARFNALFQNAYDCRTHLFYKNWSLSPLCNITRALRFQTFKKSEQVFVEIEDKYDEATDNSNSSYIKTCSTLVIRLELFFSIKGQVKFEFKSHEYLTFGKSASDALKKNLIHIKMHQGAPLNSWEDLLALLCSDDFLNKPFDKALIEQALE